jgi:dynamin 1-like protein
MDRAVSAHDGPATIVSTGRDLSGPDSSVHSGLMAGKRDGSSAAFDMKSLGKHIEAVSGSLLTHVLSA